MKKQPLLNTYVNNLSMKEAIQEICELISKKKSYVVAINVDVVVQIEKDSLLKKITDEADLTIVDGMPLVWISKFNRSPVKEKVSGSDLIPKLCEVASNNGYGIFILGGADGVAEKAKENLIKKFKNIKIVGTYSPPYGFEEDTVELEKINQIISNKHPEILLVCLGCPKQEKWIYNNYEKYDANISICAGATVDFLAGNLKRAPVWIQNIGFEWMYRFFQEPRRLFKRYFLNDLKILKIIWKYRKHYEYRD